MELTWGQWNVSRGDVVASWVEALRVGMGLAILAFPPSTRIGSFPTAVLLSEADMEQSFSAKVDTWCGPEITLCFSLPLLLLQHKLPVLIQGIFVTAHLGHTLQQPIRDGWTSPPAPLFPLSSNSDGIGSFISPHLPYTLIMSSLQNSRW